jgi:type II secretory pathway pseudopilin PulG
MLTSPPVASTHGVHRRKPFIRLNKKRVSHRRSSAGFSAVEVITTVAIIMVIAAIAIVNVQRAVRNVRLYGSGTDYSNLLQNARMRAVKDDKYYTVLTKTDVNPAIAFIDINGSGTYDLGEPETPFRPNTSPATLASGPAVGNLKSQFLPPTPSAQASVAVGGGPPTFGPRGLPCTPVAGACPYLTPTSFITFIRDANGGWGAVTVTPAGRIRHWRYDSAGNTWSPLN